MRMPCMLHRHQRLCRLSGDSYTMGTHGTYAVHTSCSCMHVHTIDTNRLRGDDEFAKIQQERALRKGDPDGTGVKPGYCDSRYYKILAGGNSQGGVGCN